MDYIVKLRELFHALFFKGADRIIPYMLTWAQRYERHLPASWSGYLIRTSRRLAMEGLRQRHCVGAQHDAVKYGLCSIAVVFLNGARWTIQIELTVHEDRPLDITRIRGRYNLMPSDNESKAIHERLGVVPVQWERPGVARRE